MEDIEKGEEPLEALMREVKEEIGIELQGIKKIGIIEIPLTLNGEIKTKLGHIFLGYTDILVEDIILTEGQKVEYFTLDEIQSQKNLAGGAISRIKEFKDFLE